MSKVKGSITCPACGQALSPRSIHQHTSECPEWGEQFGPPLPEFRYDPFISRRKTLFLSEAQEGVDYVQCKVCAGYGWDFRFRRLTSHLRVAHGLDVRSYKDQYPEAEVRLQNTTERRKATTRKKYGVDNVFQAESIKKKSRKTMLEKYGVEHNNHRPESRAKRAATNLERYGHENPFGSSEIQGKIRKTMLAAYGAENPQQVPEIRARTLETTKDRYGEEFYFQTGKFAEKFRETSLERYGVEHPMQSPEVQDRLAATMLDKYGVDNPLKDSDTWMKSYETSVQNHGGKHHLADPDVQAKARQTWMEKYGVDNPSKAEVIKARIKDVWMGKYGVPFPPQSLWVSQTHSFPNKLEQSVDDMTPIRVVYAGDGSYWVRAPGKSRARNPDFVILTPEQVEAYQNGTPLNELRTWRILEVFGDFWHGPKKTGKSREVHKKEVLDYYKAAGIECLILWESEIRKHPKRVAERIQKWL